MAYARKSRSLRAPRPTRAGGAATLAAVLACAVAGAPANASGPGAAAAPAPPSYAVGVRAVRFVDPRRAIRVHGRLLPRTLLTYVRYPAAGTPSAAETPGAPVAAGGPYPLIVFAHGFAVGQQIYHRLLDAWAAAGFVVAAPEFPFSSPDAPGAPDQDDVVNEPADLQLVVSEMLQLSASDTGPFAGLIDPSQIAVAGHSDGAESALADAYSRRLRDPRIRAAVVMSGAELSGIGGYAFPAGGPPLLAIQGTADPLNEPRYTNAYFRAAARPKYMLRLIGAGHLPPYTTSQPDLSIIERTTIAFLRGYLQGAVAERTALPSLADVAGVAELVSDP